MAMRTILESRDACHKKFVVINDWKCNYSENKGSYLEDVLSEHKENKKISMKKNLVTIT